METTITYTEENKATEKPVIDTPIVENAYAASTTVWDKKAITLFSL